MTNTGICDVVTLHVQVDGADGVGSVALKDGNYYVGVNALNTLLGISSTQQDGVLTITAQK